MSLISGFDYGTSNCALGLIHKGQAQLQALESGKAFMPSALYALHRDLIPEWLAHHWQGDVSSPSFADYKKQRRVALESAQRFRLDEGVQQNEQTLYFGQAAFDEYLAMPEEGYFIKSPKSFLGSSGLPPNAIAFIEDIVTAMMIQVKRQAEMNTSDAITHTVIGRPVNFQGVNSQESNRQAEAILSAAAKRAGFKHHEFLYEPLAAGIHFEASLEQDATVLVVDIGGGTTDCSMVRMGPTYKDKDDRTQDFLAHTGERIGGNDLDINLATYELMPLLGMGSLKKNDLPVPTQVYWKAMSINDLSAQSVFYSQETQYQLEQLKRDAQQPDLIQRLINMREDKQNYQVVRTAENTKIDLSDAEQVTVDLGFIETGLSQEVNREGFSEAIKRPLEGMLALMSDAIAQAGEKPDLIYITGGSAKSPMITQAIKARIGDVEVVDGDHFGSVATGLTLWADKIFK